MTHRASRSAAVVVAALLGACGALPVASPAPSVFLLEGVRPPGKDAAGTRAPRPADALGAAHPTVVLAPIQAAAGFDSSRMAYTRGGQQLAWFVHNEWADTPARMLGGVLLRSLQEQQARYWVVPDTGSASGPVRLELQMLQMVQDFSTHPSTLRLSLRATLVDTPGKQVLAWRAFDIHEPTASDDPAGGVSAANRASQALASALGLWCTQTLLP